MKLNRVAGLVIFALMLVFCSCGGGVGRCADGTSGGAGSGSGSGSGASGGSPGDNVCGTSNGGGGNGGGGGASNYTALLFYAPQNSSTISGAGFSGSTFAALTSSAPSQGVDARMIFVSKKFLYATIDNGVEAFVLDRATGGLTNTQGNFGFYPAEADLVSADPQGRFVFAGGITTAISVFQVNSTTGALVAAPGSPFTATHLSAVNGMTVDASGKFLYVSDGSSLVAVYSIDQSTGALTELPGSPVYLGVACLQASQASEFLVGLPICFGGGSAGIHVFSINTTSGLPTEVQGSPFSTTSSVFNFAVSPTGNFVYAFGFQAGTSAMIAPIEGYKMDSTTGALTAVSGSPFSALPTVSNCFFDQSGANMVCSDTLRVANFYAIAVDSTTGALTLQSTLPTTNLVAIDLRYAVTD